MIDLRNAVSVILEEEPAQVIETVPCQHNLAAQFLESNSRSGTEFGPKNKLHLSRLRGLFRYGESVNQAFFQQAQAETPIAKGFLTELKAEHTLAGMMNDLNINGEPHFLVHRPAPS